MGFRFNDLNDAAGGAPRAVGAATGYVFDAQGTQHVNYRSDDGHIQELWWNNNGWHHNDLTNAAGGAPRAAGDPVGYMFDAQATQHVNYRGEDGHIHELWLGSSGWQHNDLTNAAVGAPRAVGNPKGYMAAAFGTQHVNYRGGDGHIHELWWANGWRHNDLTNAAGGAPFADSDPKGYMFEAQRTQHVIYRSPTGVSGGGSVHELWWDNGGWHHNDLTNAIPVVPDAWGTPYGYMFNARGTQHVIYTSTNGFIHELWWDNRGWHHSGLTNQIGAFPVETAGYVFEAQDTQHVNYRTNDGHIQELWWGADGVVHHSDLTNDAGGAPLAASDPKGYMFDGQGTQHVIYVRSSGNVMELYWVP